ncbi:hypothetical protein [Marinoscillum sp.]|uniref:hypothetical protein n=1 Tax=Marinoscillum sp. TaxID=2024838 RepID=UPI003BADA48F
MKRKVLIGIYVMMLSLNAVAQQDFNDSYFLDARIFVDTMEYRWSKDVVTRNNKEMLRFSYDQENEVAEVYLMFDEESPVTGISLVPSGDFSQVDSLILFRDYARFKVQFNSLTNSDFLKFTFRVNIDSTEEIVELPLYPYTEIYVKLYPNTDELYIGEEKVFELTSNNVENIVPDNRWTEGLPINYRTTRDGPRLLLHLLPNKLGNQQLEVPFKVKRPFRKNGQFIYDLEPLQVEFSVKSGRLVFLKFDQQEVTPKEDKTEPIEVQIDNNRFLRLDKTYRIENQEESGGPLIAELYTKARLNNDKVLCLLRPYAFHRQSEGYLYIKEGDDPWFVTNVDITPKTSIQSIYVQREGKDWQKSNVVYPGETINIKLEGEGLHKANFSFPGANNLDYDSLIKNEQISLFRIKIPLTINSNSIEIFNHNESTGSSLRVQEYQRPRDLDFIDLDFGTRQVNVANVDKPIYYEETLTDLVFDFQRSKIDDGDLYGKQYLTIKVKISNKKGNLIELYQFDEVVVCPNEASPRFVNYESKDCRGDDINLNNFISKKTSELEEWSRIELEISHIKSKYGGAGKTKKILIHLKRDYNFDIDVSFPAGLLILKSGTKAFTNFGGVSFAMIAQMSFYQEGKIAKYKPYKIGAGFIAIDAFNFSESGGNRDVGLVVIGSLYPTSSDNKLTFPLYAGGGYLMSEQKMFFLIGPGIRVRL